MSTRKPRADVYNSDCPSQGILALIGSKWSMLILCALRAGPMRTNELKRRLRGVSRRRCASWSVTASSSARTSARYRREWNIACQRWDVRWPH